jgi:peptidoglycan/LPS O-acetylase OafA/YrhL
MAVSEEHLRHSVDAILEPALRDERRKLLRRRGRIAACRVVLGLVVLWAIVVVVHFFDGVPFPWGRFAAISFLAALVAMPDWALPGEDRAARLLGAWRKKPPSD